MTPQEAQAILNQSPQQAMPMTAANAQAILAQAPNSASAPQQPQSSWLNNIPASMRALGADVGTVGQDLSNDVKGVVNPFIPNSAPQGLKNFFAPDTENYYSDLGVAPNVVDNLATGIGHYAAYANPITDAVRGASLASDAVPAASGFLARTFSNPVTQGNIAASSVYGGLTSPNNPIGGTAGGVAIGVAAPLVTGAGSGLVKGAQNLYAKTALPGLISKGTDAVMGSLGNPQDYATQLGGKFDEANTTNNANWADVAQKAANLDTQVNDKNALNIEPYKNYITNFLNDYQAKTPLQAANLQNAAEFAGKQLDMLPQNFTDLVQGRQLLNQNLNNFNVEKQLDAPDANTLQFVKGLKDTLPDTLAANKAVDNPQDVQDLQDAWDKANQSHTFLQRFTNTTNSVGADKNSRPLNSAFKGPQDYDASILNQYIPAGSQTGTNEYQNLADLYGNAPQAQSAINSYALRDANIKGDPGQTVMNYYQKQSPAQRQFLFNNTPAQPYLNSASQGIANYGAPTAPNSLIGGIHHYGLHYGLPGMLGFGAGMVAGLPWEQAALLGAGTAAGSKGISKIIQKNATPGLINRTMASGQAPIQATGTVPSYLLNPAIQGATQ